MKLAIDLDGVCFDTMGGFAKIHGEPTGPITDYWIDERYYPTLSPAAIRNTFNETKVYELAPPIPYAPQVLNVLWRTNQIEYVTARPPGTRDVTLAMLRKYRFPLGKVVMPDGHAKKVEYLKVEMFDVVLDDSIDVIEGVGQFVRFPYIFTRPWNAHFQWLMRVHTWKEFLHRFI